VAALGPGRDPRPAARRTARRFGLCDDYESREPGPGEPIPEWLGRARAAVGELAGVPRAIQRGQRQRRRVWEVTVEPRSGYVLAGEVRWSSEHSIPAVKELRYSITFRTVR
jgi:hypothetical protein